MNTQQTRADMGTIGLVARERAHTILHEVLDRGRPLDEVLQTDKRFGGLNDRDRAFARNLVATTLRRLGQIDALIDDCLDRPLPVEAAAAKNALRLGLCQILFLDTQTHAAVDTAVSLAAKRGPEKFKGVVNAILRRIVRAEGQNVLAHFPEQLNVPDWLWESWVASFGEEAATVIAASQLQIPPVDLTIRDDAEDGSDDRATERAGEWAEYLGGERIGRSSVRMTNAGDITALDGFDDGVWWVQDAAAALPADVLIAALARTGSDTGNVCDLCAAPGGKTAQLVTAGLDVTAVDVSGTRLGILHENLDRLGLAAAVVEADALAWEPPALFDAVLLDAPCSATGTIRRHPDIPYLKTPADVTHQTDLQRKFLDKASAMVRPGGVIVYSVCSLEDSEGPRQIARLLKRDPSLRLETIAAADVPDFKECIAPEGYVRVTPAHLADRGGVDGFFIARLRKKDTL
jgi:16S rRNA (cytosine967-C5)-methyltransferase